ncbi:bifunctional diguanylate cyclase/phosphodiesterase [Moritella sp. Urea-trap-13]|uniref:putative bifunctional diguanylate cyclase/phosphodiesterase n=1 Tax=Moritella sp. Urea-trap-13 TaxID=2058327 RepID=UPI001E43FA99|nr:GGDEF domain-containing phosphodiesterase [Moritella sp. Urea-trap-13]
MWHWNLLTQESMLGASIFAFDHMRNEYFSQAVIAWEKHLHPDDRERGNSEVQALLHDGKQLEIDFRVLQPNGNFVHIKSMVRVLHNDAGKLIRIDGTNIDITEFKCSEAKLKLAASAFTYASEGIAITDPAGNIIDVNNAFTAITGYSCQEVLGKNTRMLKSGRHTPAFYTEMWKTLIEKDHWRGEIWNCRKNGEIYPELLSINLVRDNDGDITRCVALFSDISHIKEHQKKLEKMAHFDPLTYLPNRTLLRERLSSAKRQCLCNKQLLAVLFIDLDGFKTVNDRYGHDVGDELLIALSHRMRGTLREHDTLARIGGDEFVAVLTELENKDDCKSILERLLLAISDTVTVGKIRLQVSASIGVTFYPQDHSDSDLLIRHADQAMYEAKKAGKNCYFVFDLITSKRMDTRRVNFDRIRMALQKDEFVLYYQPKVNLRKGTVIGAEALIRWQHPERELLLPGEFLPLIENYPISIELGEWVIATALSQIAAWQALGLNIPVSVNISALQLQQNGFAERLQVLLSAWPQVEPRFLLLEVLETSALADVMQVSKIMHDCIDLGVSFALDDFGTGYSSLTYLRHLPASLIKIDQSFVRDMLINPDDLMIVESVVGLAKSFKREVIAEGVETRAHSAALLQLGCELMQGYGIARPMPAGNIPEWMANWSSGAGWAVNNLIDRHDAKAFTSPQAS